MSMSAIVFVFLEDTFMLFFLHFTCFSSHCNYTTKLRSVRFSLLLINQRLDSTAFIWLLKWIMKTSSRTWRLIKTSLLHNTWSSLAEFVGTLSGSAPTRLDTWKWIVEWWQSGEWHVEVSEVCSLLLAIWVVALDTHWQLRYSSLQWPVWSIWTADLFVFYSPYVQAYGSGTSCFQICRQCNAVTATSTRQTHAHIHKPLTTAVQSTGHSGLNLLDSASEGGWKSP